MGEKIKEPIKVSLPIEETIDGKQVTELLFREAKGADIERILGLTTGESVSTLASALCTNIPLDVEDVRNLAAKNYLAVSDVILDFLG